eukprot:2851008-Amphidinium_carterae.1
MAKRLSVCGWAFESPQQHLRLMMQAKPVTHQLMTITADIGCTLRCSYSPTPQCLKESRVVTHQWQPSQLPLGSNPAMSDIADFTI